MTMQEPGLARVVIVGAGFAGIAAAQALRDARAEIVVLDRQNHHCFQPLLYQVATAGLTPADIAWPIRSILARQRNTRVVMTEVLGIDLAARQVRTDADAFGYDFLLVAAGATHAHFGHDEWARHAPGLKAIDDATAIRRRLLTAFERAELAADPAEQRRLMTFAIVGGGPTGVELAGAIADMARLALPGDFRRIDPRRCRVALLEAGPRILPAFPPALSAYAEAALERLGVEVRTGSKVTGVEPGAVHVDGAPMPVAETIWAAGVAASPAGRWLGAELDRVGRVRVSADLSLPGHPEVFVAGDLASLDSPDGRPVPGLASAAKQMGKDVGRRIAARIEGRPELPPFAYRHQGDLATIGRRAAIARLDALTLTGFPGWLFWGLVHIYFLIGARNRIAVAFSWVWDYLTLARRSRLITGTRTPGGHQGDPA